MSAGSKIEWTNETWVPVTGCHKVSHGCKNCYAEAMHARLSAMGQAKYARPFREVVCHPAELARPLTWRTPRMVFLSSMSDVFHDDVPSQFLLRLFETMRQAHWHTFQVLTKRARRLEYVCPGLPWSPNVWMGVSVETDEHLDRVDYLHAVPARVRFLSIEPLLGPLPRLDLSGIHWVIVGGESGPNARPCDVEWIRGVVRQCERAGVPVFVKQLGARPVLRTGLELELRDRKGGDPGEWPEDLQVREWPSQPAMAPAAGEADPWDNAGGSSP